MCRASHRERGSLAGRGGKLVGLFIGTIWPVPLCVSVGEGMGM